MIPIQKIYLITKSFKSKISINGTVTHDMAFHALLGHLINLNKCGRYHARQFQSHFENFIPICVFA